MELVVLEGRSHRKKKTLKSKRPGSRRQLGTLWPKHSLNGLPIKPRTYPTEVGARCVSLVGATTLPTRR